MSVANDSTNNSSNACIVCYKNVEYYSIGMCEHPVCYECSTRMRVLCQQNECPICRQDLPKVVFTKEIKPFRFLRKGNLVDIKYNIYFDNHEIQEKFLKLLAHTCTICEANQTFSSFNYLKDHVKRKHDLHYCELCVDNLKIFSCERRSYSGTDLLQHQRKGDLDDKSHKGHPLCKFCEQRYMDVDELYRHLRRDHLFCHFCDADGLHHYYDSYDYLRKHFQDEHHLCEEGDCAEEQFTSVFRTDIDLRAHKANVHGKHLSKAAAKQARTLELEFTLAPRANPRGSRGPPGGQRGGRDYGGYHGDSGRPQPHPAPSPPPTEPTFEQQPLVDVQSTQEFPRLGNSSVAPLIPNHTHSKGRGGHSVYSNMRKGNYDQNFPALGAESATGTPPAVLPKTLNFSLTSTNKNTGTASARQSKTSSNPSVNVNHRPNGTVMTRLGGGSNMRMRQMPSRDSDFPALGRGHSEPTPTPCTQSWTKVTCVKPAPQPKVAPAPLAYSPPPLRSGQDFPSLSKTTKSGKNTGQPSSHASSSWLQSTDTSNSSLVGDATKGKAKKKKMKQQTASNGTYGAITASDTRKSEQMAKPKVKPKSDEEPEHGVTSPPGSAASAQRKRFEQNLSAKDNNSSSEVKTTNNASRPDNFPALGYMGSRPPGLASPPPGFGGSSAISPPPGFLSRLNGLTFTNSSGESYTVVPDEADQPQPRTYTYHPLDGFQRRNQNLIAKFNDCFGPEDSDDFKAFRYLSRSFRSGDCSASTYYEQCQLVMGRTSFNRLFPELLVLLPDIDKQRELYDVHKLKINPDFDAAGLTECANCGQILLGTDLKSHATSHSLENHFPALGKGSQSSSSGSWSRK